MRKLPNRCNPWRIGEIRGKIWNRNEKTEEGGASRNRDGEENVAGKNPPEWCGTDSVRFRTVPVGGGRSLTGGWPMVVRRWSGDYVSGSWILMKIDEYWWVLMNMWWTLKNNWEKNILLFLIFERKVRVIFSVCELWECYVIICGSKEYIECDMGHGFGPKWMDMVNGPQNNTNK